MASVVVADPDDTARDLAVRLLHAAQHTVVPVTDATALQRVLRSTRAPRIVVMRVDDLALAHALLALFPFSDAFPAAIPADPPARSSPAALPDSGLPALQASPASVESSGEPAHWATRHAYILVAQAPLLRLLAAGLAHLRPAFVRYAPTLRTAEDAVRLLILVTEGSQALGARTH